MNSMIIKLVAESTLQTIEMVFWSTVFSLIMGLPLGVLLHVTDREDQGGIIPKPLLNEILSRIVNILRSFPFLILMIVLMPVARFILGTTIGTRAAVVSLSIAAAPFVARVIETSLKEVDPGVVQAAKAMGSTNWQIIVKVMLPEALPSLVSGVTLTIINLIGYSAMAGTIGGGGLGDLAIRYGYQRFRSDVMLAAVIVTIVLVEPEIPMNTGNIARTCAATGSRLHLVRPLGFDISDRAVKRAGLDYWHLVDLRVYDDLDELFQRNDIQDLWLATTKAPQAYSQAKFRDGCWLFFGKETAGLPEWFREQHRERCLRLPMRPEARSLNLANSVAVFTYEALRQLDFLQLQGEGEMGQTPPALLQGAE